MPEVASSSPVLFFDFGGQEPGGSGLVPEVAVDAVLFGPLLLVRGGFAGEEFSRVLANKSVAFGLPRGAVVREDFSHVEAPFCEKAGRRFSRNAC